MRRCARVAGTAGTWVAAAHHLSRPGASWCGSVDRATMATVAAAVALAVPTPELVVYRTQTCIDCHAAQRALDAIGIAYREVDLADDPAAVELVMRLNDGKRSVPTLVYGEVAASLSRFTPSKLSEFLQAAGLR